MELLQASPSVHSLYFKLFKIAYHTGMLTGGSILFLTPVLIVRRIPMSISLSGFKFPF